jgi:hypothetical protein
MATPKYARIQLARNDEILGPSKINDLRVVFMAMMFLGSTKIND